jgi:outer membrane protein
MKKLSILVIVVVAMLGATQVEAQKIAYVNMQELVTGMPEYAQADTALGNYRNDLVQQMQAMQQELQTKAGAFVQDSLKMSEAIKEVKRSELRDLQNRIGQMQQSSQRNCSRNRTTCYSRSSRKHRKRWTPWPKRRDTPTCSTTPVTARYWW